MVVFFNNVLESVSDEATYRAVPLFSEGQLKNNVTPFYITHLETDRMRGFTGTYFILSNFKLNFVDLVGL